MRILERDEHAQGWESEKDGRVGRETAFRLGKGDDVMNQANRVADKVFPQKAGEQVQQIEGSSLAKRFVGNRGEKGESSRKYISGGSELVQPSLHKEDGVHEEEGSGLNIGPIDGNPVQLTRIDLEERKIRPGLGPSTLAELQIEAKNIGLKEKVIVLDILSLDRQKNFNSEAGPSQLDMTLNAEQIKKVKQVIATKNFGPRKEGQARSKQSRELVVWEPREKVRTAQGMDYYVEQLKAEQMM